MVDANIQQDIEINEGDTVLLGVGRVLGYAIKAFQVIEVKERRPSKGFWPRPELRADWVRFVIAQ